MTSPEGQFWVLAARTVPVPLVTAPLMSVLLAASFSELLTHLWEWRPCQAEWRSGRQDPSSPVTQKWKTFFRVDSQARPGNFRTGYAETMCQTEKNIVSDCAKCLLTQSLRHYHYSSFAVLVAFYR